MFLEVVAGSPANNRTVADLAWAVLSSPIGWAAVVAAGWFIISSLFSLTLDRVIPRTDEGWAEMFARRPRVAALASLLKTAGFNVPGAWRAIRSFLTGKPPAILLGSAAPKNAADLAAIFAAAKAEALDEFKRAATTITPTPGETVIINPPASTDTTDGLPKVTT